MLRIWWERYRRLLLAVGAVLFVTSSIWLYQTDHARVAAELPLQAAAYAAEETVAEETPQQKGSLEKEGKADKPDTPLLYVDVKGKVKQPGLYHFESGMRVADAIAKAGGSLPEADLEQINLAQPLTDGSAIVIPAKGAASASTPGTIAPFPAARAPGETAVSPADPPTVNINTASLEELMTLAGIGETRAKAILEYRSQNGAFRSPEEITQIEGIGDKMYERIKGRIRIQ